jgi:ribonuclease R
LSRALGQRVIDYLQNEAAHPLRANELGMALRIKPADRKAFRGTLRQLVADGRIMRLRRGRYAAPDRIRLLTGELRVSRGGHGFVIPDSGDPDVHVAPAAIGPGLDGDRVAVRLEGVGRNGKPEGRVVRVIERGRSSVVGRWKPARPPRRLAFVVPEDRRIARDVLVPEVPDPPPSKDDIVVVRVTDWGDEHRTPIGVVEEVLGPPDAPGVDVLAIIRAYDLATTFPREVTARAEAIRERGIRPGDLRGREDLRDLHVVTIDPPDAKDHDDALSIRDAGSGETEVGVHIADVSFYVRPGSVIDREARLRATSVYLVDRAIPMLPEALSSDVCSLVPDRDRLTLSMFLTIDGEGRVRDGRLAATIIRSRHRLSYDRVQKVFDGAESIDPETDSMLGALRDVSRKLRARRMRRGSLDFDLPEARVFLDDSGAPVDVQRADRLDSHRLVEDLMLAANEAVGGRAGRDGYPFIYRIHEPPDPDRLAQVAGFARALGFDVPFRGVPDPLQIQSILEQKPDTPQATLLATLVLRSMKQAKYSETDIGHYGLATRGYTHFTSPIRRYPDLLVHRIVGAHHLGRGDPARYTIERLADLARHASRRERVAADAERDSIQLKKLRFMERHVGSTFDGTISDVRPFGIFVLLEKWFIEGLIHVSALQDDYYEWVEERFLLAGQSSGRRFRVGQRVRVQVAGVDTEERRIDFVLAGEDNLPRKRRARRSRRK